MTRRSSEMRVTCPGKVLLSIGDDLGSVEENMPVEAPDPLQYVRIKRKNTMTTQTRNKIDSIAFPGLLVALASFLVWFLIAR